jgi:serine/threonine protein kinase
LHRRLVKRASNKSSTSSVSSSEDTRPAQTTRSSVERRFPEHKRLLTYDELPLVPLVPEADVSAITHAVLRDSYRKASKLLNIQQRVLIFGEMFPKVLGRGSFGTVFTCKNPRHCYKCFKTPRDYCDEKIVAKYLLDVSAKSNVWPKNLLRVGDAEKFENPLIMFGETYIGCILMERMQGHLGAIEEFTLPQANSVFIDIGAALCALSDLGLCHTDVKIQNVLLYNKNNQLRMKLGDIAGITRFSFCDKYKVRGTAGCVSPTMLTNFIQHKRSLPEPILYVIENLPDTFLVANLQFNYMTTEDMWQFGIMLLEMLNPEFRGLNSGRTGWWEECARDIEEGYSIDTQIKESIMATQIENYIKDVILEPMLDLASEKRLQFALLKNHLHRVTLA